MLLENILISDQFIKYTAILAISIYRKFENSDAVSIIVRIHIIIILIDRSIILF
jgi:hypothetical protein